ncbi:MAG TPA: redoxin domain-containing protein [Thiolapillus brandeum]|uniref:Thioredoxin n=1 Tax=Thiolapillus brandeum TaxID=1076588 RepID=A0A7C5IZ79_9GAMM|nr:redoxin domain-containing protein [Thiolapillus brandeum]
MAPLHGKTTKEFEEAHLHDFPQKVLEASARKPVLVDFWADWCAPCHAIAPHLERVMEEMAHRVALVKVEVDEGENMKLAGRYKLRGFPTLMLFVEGEEVARFAGNRASHWIRDWLNEHLPPQD